MTLKFAWSLLAFFALAIMVWLVGPIISIGEAQPLASSLARSAVICMVALLIFAPLLHRYIQLRKAEKALKTGLMRQDEESRIQSEKLQTIFHQAVNLLKENQSPKAWYLSKPGLYELPWYIIIGPPGSGKSTLLKNAGLRFPLQDLHGRNSIKGIGGTRNCDWWFTDQAVLIDTAGRFTTQDADAHTDATGWEAFLKLLRRYRPRQPVNGVLLTLSVQDLLDTEQKREEIASRISLRLQEMVRMLGMCPPVYVLVTKLDLLPGFQETFGRLGEQERSQPWGVNFQHPNKIDTVLKSTLPTALQDMIHHLDLQLNQRLQQQPQEQKRVKLFEFPLACARLKPLIEKLIEQALQSDSPFEKPVVLRGLYFCSGTQEASMFDRIMSATPATTPPGVTQPSTGRGFFIRDLLLQVVFAEQHLAGLVRKADLFHKAVYRGALVSALALVLALSTGWWLSWSNNTAALAATVERSSLLAEQVGSKPVEASFPPVKLFRHLSQLELLVQESPGGLTHQLGLNQDDKLQQAEKIAYRNALVNSLMPWVAMRLEDRLRLALNQNEESAYEALKAYLMLHSPANFQAGMLADWVIEDWSTQLLGMQDEKTRKEATRHLKAAIELGIPAVLPEKNLQLVRNARQIIGSRPLEERLYLRMNRLYKSEQPVNVNPIEKMGASTTVLLMRHSGKSVNEDVDGFYTRTAYLNFLMPRLTEQASALSREAAWVMEESPAVSNNRFPDTARLVLQVRERYLRDYVQHWDSYLKDIRLKNLDDLNQAVELSRVLASAQSPLKNFIAEVVQHTRFAPPEVMKGPAGILLEQKVDEHFRAINSLFADRSPGYLQVSELFNALYNQLAAIAVAKNSGMPPPPQTAIESLRLSAGLLPEPVRMIASQLAAYGSAHNQVADRARLSANIQPLAEMCRKMVTDRYPVHAASSLDILPGDFARFFGPAGAMDQFFQDRLTSPAGAGSAPFTAAQLQPFKNASQIRDTFFQGNSRVPSFDIEMRLIQSTPSNDVFYLEVDGELKMFSRQYQPAHTIRWGSQGASSILRVRASEGEYRNFKGSWALFRLFDTGKTDSISRPEQFRIKFELDDKTFDFEVLTNSVFNPLRLKELRQFRCPAA